MIVQTSDNRLYSVRDGGADMPQAWIGFAVKKTAAGYVAKANAREQLVRRADSRVVSDEVVA